MEVMGIVWAVVGGLSLVCALAEIKNRLHLRAERKAEQRAKDEAREADRAFAEELRNRRYACKSDRHIGAPEHRRPW
jgi:hypothetical protein